MHKKVLKFALDVDVELAQLEFTDLYHSSKLAKARPQSVECPTDSSVQRQWSVAKCMPIAFELQQGLSCVFSNCQT